MKRYLVSVLFAIAMFIVLFALPLHLYAETYIINGTKDQGKLKAIVALANDPKAQVQRCQYKEKQDSNEGAVLCRPVELGPRGTIRLVK